MSSTALQKRDDDAGAIMERVLIVGDLAKLTPQERVSYYNAVCTIVGLNPLTRPFSYLVLSGKLTLYANKDCSDQLRKNNKVSIYKIEKEQDGDLFIVTAYARTADGREDVDMGAVSTATAKGDNLVNARLKAVTKAKRRVTLSICGLGFLDETEIDTIPDARKVSVTESGEVVEHQQPAKLLPMPPAQPEIIEAEPVVAKIAESTAQSIRALAARKGKDIDAMLANKGKPAVEHLTVEEADIAIRHLESLADAGQPTEQAQRTPAQQQIRLFWDELKLDTQKGIEHFTQWLDDRGLSFDNEVRDETDIPDGLAKPYANYLGDLVTQRKAGVTDDRVF